ncbi:MAG TPA: FAD-binding domain-containing protein [Kiritimatiellia bacterium]|nr:FAD-binding domain-containing protein [Kiritimatiellia bacterium]
MIRATLARHDFAAAEAFAQEVCWRTYWKGWLEMRPAVWTRYESAVRESAGRRESCPRYREAVEGRTGIPCFDAFVIELRETGYLHNHARMWFASIWIFTLDLRWEWGADFFLRHLLDGDPASNTLSWRWVGGLQTSGKFYAATPDNIRRFTSGRFPHPGELKIPSGPLVEIDSLPTPRNLPARGLEPPREPVGALLTEDDVSGWRWIAGLYPVCALAGLVPREAYQRRKVEAKVLSFREALMGDALNSGMAEGLASHFLDVGDPDAAVEWAMGAKLKTVVMIEPAVGYWDRIKPDLQNGLAAAGIELVWLRRPWDDQLHPHATAGFFRFKKRLPGLAETIMGRP